MRKKPSKMGRPPVPKKEALAQVFSVRLKQGEAKAVRAAITSSKAKASTWLRDALLEKARKG